MLGIYKLWEFKMWGIQRDLYPSHCLSGEKEGAGKEVDAG